MNLHHLKLFRTVASVSSVSVAAEQLLISQSAVSSQLKQFEQSLGAPLFTRLPRGMSLTASGRTLLEYADRIFELAEQASRAVRDVQGLRRGSLRIGASPTIATYFLPPVLLHYQRRFPEIEVQVEVNEVHLLDQRLREGLIDLALRPTAPLPGDVDGNIFMHDEFVAIAARGHRLSKSKTVQPGQIAEGFVARQLPSATGSLAFGFFAGHQVHSKPVISLGSVEAVKQAVLVGLGVSILSKMAVASELVNRRLVVLKVPGLPLRRPLYVLKRPGPESKASIAFGCLLKHAARGKLPKLGVEQK